MCRGNSLRESSTEAVCFKDFNLIPTEESSVRWFEFDVWPGEYVFCLCGCMRLDLSTGACHYVVFEPPVILDDEIGPSIINGVRTIKSKLEIHGQSLGDEIFVQQCPNNIDFPRVDF